MTSSHSAGIAKLVVIPIIALLVAMPLSTASGQISKTAWEQETAGSYPTGPGCFVLAYPSLTWSQTPCGGRVTNLMTVGNGNDYVGYSGSGSSKIIGDADGWVLSMSGFTSEYDSKVSVNSGVDYYSLQLNSQTFYTTVGGVSVLAWQQFIFENNGVSGGGVLFMQYWLLGYLNNNASCPSNWYPQGKSCVISTGGTNTNTGYWLVSSSGGVFGYGNASEANFNSGTSIEIEVHLWNATGYMITPTCSNSGYTGETNNLFLSSCSVNGAAYYVDENN